MFKKGNMTRCVELGNCILLVSFHESGNKNILLKIKLFGEIVIFHGLDNKGTILPSLWLLSRLKYCQDSHKVDGRKKV